MVCMETFGAQAKCCSSVKFTRWEAGMYYSFKFCSHGNPVQKLRIGRQWGHKTTYPCIKYKHKLLNTVHKTHLRAMREDRAQVYVLFVYCKHPALRILFWSSELLLLQGPWLQFQLELYLDPCRKNSLDQLLGKKCSRLVQFLYFIQTAPLGSSADEVCYCLWLPWIINSGTVSVPALERLLLPAVSSVEAHSL